MSLAAYRTLLRSARIAFQGDSFALSAARTEARKGFEQNRQAELSADEWTKAVRYAEDVARLLRENVVQGRRTPDGSGNIKLRIHEHTERGDNESIKMAGREFAGKCCSS